MPALTLDQPYIIKAWVERDPTAPGQAQGYVKYVIENVAGTRRTEVRTIPMSLTLAQKQAVQTAALAAINAEEGL